MIVHLKLQVVLEVGTKLGKNLGGAKQRQLARKEVQQISVPPTCTSTTEISDGGSTGLHLLASGRGGWSPLAPPLAPCLAGGYEARQHNVPCRTLDEIEPKRKV